MASCYWGCHGKEHIFEYLAGRTYTSAASAYKLMCLGYYDESLGLSRNIAEIGNLTHLFFADGRHIRLWLDSSDKERREKYRPVKVRLALEKIGSVVPTDKDRYAWLSEVGVHVTPQTLPQSHNNEERPILGNVFQAEGWNASLEALAWSVCTVTGPLAKLSIMDKEYAERLFEETISLIKAV